MVMIEFKNGEVQVDAMIVAEGLAMDPSLVHECMRDGNITSLCERGTDEDDGRWRLSFFSKNRRLRLVVDKHGNVVQRSAVDFGDRGLPASARKPVA